MIVEYASESSSEGAKHALVRTNGSSNAQKPEFEKPGGAVAAVGAEDGMCIILAYSALALNSQIFQWLAVQVGSNSVREDQNGMCIILPSWDILLWFFGARLDDIIV
jgi:hypothetical protein